MISLEELVSADSDYRKSAQLFNFKKIEYRLKKLEKDLCRTSYGTVRLFKCLLYQFMENLSDKELEISLKK